MIFSAEKNKPSFYHHLFLHTSSQCSVCNKCTQ